jgi:hypothetical protein
LPYAKRECGKCGREYRPKAAGAVEQCNGCSYSERVAAKVAAMGPPPALVDLMRDENTPPKRFEPKRDCAVCARPFLTRLGETWCAACKKLAETEENTAFDNFEPGGPLPQVKTHHLAPPLKQAVFDLETFSLDRGWGVLMVGSILVHGDGPEPKMYTFDLTESPKWPDIRSDDSDLAARIMQILSKCHVLYAHNGARYDIPWLNSLALKYKLPRLNCKLIDPVQVARQKYRIGSNSLGAVANFLNLSENKMPVPPDVWRTALFDNNQDSWKTLRERCESDVRLLNMVAAEVTLDVGMIDRIGSFRG